jgi:mannose-6-phosphate isomerase
MKFFKIKKPWGYEILLEKNKKYMFKKLFMKKGHRCSLQFHRLKRETIYILRGTLKITSGNNINKLNSKIYRKDQSITIKPRLKHRMQAISDCYYLESSTPELTDVIRIRDDYNRS